MSPKRPIKLNDQTMEVIEGQFQAFEKKFGRKMGPNDPVFFDPDLPYPARLSEEKSKKMWDEIAKMLLEAVPHRPELAYATKKTGRIVSDENIKYLTKEEIGEWNAAVKEYRDLAQKGQAPEI